MPTYTMRAPDGRTYTIQGPAGATEAQVRAEIIRRNPAAGQAPRAQPKKDDSFWQGFAEGITPIAANAGRIMAKSNPFSMLADTLGGLVGADRSKLPTAQIGNIERTAMRALANTKYRGTTAGKITGEVVGTLPTLMIPGGPIVQGAAGGLLMSDMGDPRSVASNVALGAVAGKVGEQVGKRVLAPVAERIGRTAPARAIARGVNQAISTATGRARQMLPNPTIVPVERRMADIVTPGRTVGQRITGARNAPDFSQAQANLADAASMKLPYALADADPRLRNLAGSVTRFSPDARAMAERNFVPRAEDQAVRAMQGIDNYLAPPVDVKQRGRDLMFNASEQAGPLYDDAFRGGSMAPLETQFTDAFGKSSAAVAAAKRKLGDAQREALLSSADINRAGNNVYANSRALPRGRGANSAVSQLEQELAAAEAAHARNLDLLRRAQTDGSANAPGAVWSSRVQEFLDDPIAQSGLARGLEVQRLEALAAGKPFNPTELAITGMDEAGKPIVASVPNMRTMDSVKKGLDEFINEYEKDVMGRPILDQRGRAIDQVRKSLLSELDGLNPDYAAARGEYARFAQQRDALNRGYESTGRTTFARDIDNFLPKMPPENLSEFRSGYATSLRDQVSNASDASDPYKLIYGGNERRAKMASVFPEGEAQFGRLASLENDMRLTATETLGGSQTQARAVNDEYFQNGGAQLLGGLAVDAATGSPMSAASRIARSLADRGNLGLLGARQKADALAPTLLGTSADTSQEFLADLARRLAERETRREAYRRVGGMFGVPAGAGSLVALGE